jgi:RsiW-degrading membrane proteinase PrsW (M82 family)
MSDNHAGVGLSALAATLPVLIYLIVIWRFDRYEREPWWLVLLTFIYGAIGAIILGIILSLVVIVAAGKGDDFSFGASIVAPLCEEPSKGLIVYLLLLTRHFDNTTDGLIYGAASGLGFAMTENFLYFTQSDAAGGMEQWQQVVILRSLFSALMHCAATAMFGAILGRFRYRGGVKQWLVAPLVGLALAMTLHAAFNTALVQSAAQGEEQIAYLGFGLVPIAAITLFSLTMISLGREHRMLAAELREEAAVGIIPMAHADILPFHRRRWKNGWLDPRINKKRYIEAATLLAFRKWQSKLPAGRRYDVANELVNLRKEVAYLLRAANPPPPGPPPGPPPMQGGPYYPPPN